MIDYTVVVPTTGRSSLRRLVTAVDAGKHPPAEIYIVDDRLDGRPLRLPPTRTPVTVLCSNGKGPAAARNVGLAEVTTGWVVFLDDDVEPGPDWSRLLHQDLMGRSVDVAAVSGRITVPLPADRRPTDAERNTAALETARWVTADIAYRTDVVHLLGGFDERFRRAFREDADLALRVVQSGYDIAVGDRVTVHPPRDERFFASVRAQAGNADNALMRAKHGSRWRDLIGEAPGRSLSYAMVTGTALAGIGAAVSGRPRVAGALAAVWSAYTSWFAAQRIFAGPKNPAEVGRMAVSSALIPPVASAYRLAGWVRHRHLHRRAPAAILFDRDDTLIDNVPYLNDPNKVDPVPGAAALLEWLRFRGIKVGVVSNQSGVAKGLITPDQLIAVEDEVRRLLGPFDTWQTCPHDDETGCDCRKPAPGMIVAAAAELNVHPRDCVVVGDTGADMAAAGAAGARGILVPTCHTLSAEIDWAKQYAEVVSDLRGAVRSALAGPQ